MKAGSQARIEKPYLCRQNPELRLPNQETCEQRRAFGNDGKEDYIGCAACAGPLQHVEQPRPAPSRCSNCNQPLHLPLERKSNGQPYRVCPACRQATENAAANKKAIAAGADIICGRCSRPLPQPYELKPNGQPYRMHPECREKNKLEHSLRPAKKEKTAAAQPATVEAGELPVNTAALALAANEGSTLATAPAELECDNGCLSRPLPAPAPAPPGQPPQNEYCCMCGLPVETGGRFYLSLSGLDGSMNHKARLCHRLPCFNKLAQGLLQAFQDMELR